jgi:hypothetical protein
MLVRSWAQFSKGAGLQLGPWISFADHAQLGRHADAQLQIDPCVLRSMAASAKVRGKEKQSEQAAKVQMIAPEAAKRPKRTQEELADAEARAKEYSRQCMHRLRAFQKKQKRRIAMRCAFGTPVQRRLRVSVVHALLAHQAIISERRIARFAVSCVLLSAGMMPF